MGSKLAIPNSQNKQIHGPLKFTQVTHTISGLGSGVSCTHKQNFGLHIRTYFWELPGFGSH